MLTVGCAIAHALSGAAAVAQTGTDGFDAQRYVPMPAAPGDLLNVSGSVFLRHLGVGVGVDLHYADDSLEILTPDGSATRFVDDQLTMELSAALGLFGYGQLGISMPLVVFAEGLDLTLAGRPGETIASFALGDLRVVPRVRFWDPNDLHGFGVHVGTVVSVPTGSSDDFTSDGAVRVRPYLGLDYRHSSGLVVAINAGYELRPRRVAYTAVSDDQLHWSLALELPTARDIRFVTSVWGAFQFEKSIDADGAETTSPTPIELLVGLTATIDVLRISAGAGGPLNDAAGVADLRAWLSLAFVFEDDDADDDGILNERDRCVDVAEDVDGFEDDDGCPEIDNDGDGFVDAGDGCPNLPEDLDGFEDEDGCPEPDNDNDGLPDGEDQCPLDAEDFDGFQDEDGCLDEDNDADGVLDVDDKCPLEPEDLDGVEDEDGCREADRDNDGINDREDGCPDQAEDIDGFEDDDGCPDDDNDGDGVPDERDRCPNHPETKNRIDDNDGCPDSTATGITITPKQVIAGDGIGFDYRKARFAGGAARLVKEVATALKENPWITQLRIESHTERTGTVDVNQRLSEARARAVRQALLKAGVSQERVVAVGMGESLPLLPDAREGNERLELWITGNNGKPNPGVDRPAPPR